MFRIATTIIFLLFFAFQNVMAQGCENLVKNLYPSPEKSKSIETIKITSVSESFLLGEILTFEITRTINPSDNPSEQKVYMTLKALGKGDSETLIFKLEKGEATMGNSDLPVSQELEDVLRQSLSQPWLLPDEYIVVSCADFKSYQGKLEGKEATIRTSFVPGKTEEVRIIFDSDTGVVKGFYTPSSSPLPSFVLIDNYEKREDNIPLSFKTSTFYLDGDELILVGTESTSLTVEELE